MQKKKNIPRRFMAVFLVLMLALCPRFVCAASGSAVSLTVSQAQAASGGQAVVTVELGPDSHAAGGSFDLKYDIHKCKVIETMPGEMLAAASPSINVLENSGIIRFAFLSEEEITRGGVILQAVLAVNEEAREDIPLALGNMEFVDGKYETVPIEPVNGKIILQTQKAQAGVWLWAGACVIVVGAALAVALVFFRKKRKTGRGAE